MLLITEKDDGKTVNAHVGEPVRIILPENATTGYRWAVDRIDEEFIQVAPEEPRYAADAIGSGGEAGFTFLGRKTGTGEIMLKHWRHWEGDSSITRRFHLYLNVQD